VNHIVCRECKAKKPGPEKCCTHGTEVGIKCVECGKVRVEGDPYWACLGTVKEEAPPP